jgi:SAM-dependent MidA family methyltransferase
VRRAADVLDSGSQRRLAPATTRKAFGSRRFAWRDTLPARIDGIVLANEVLDAVPCEIVRFSNGEYQQAYVACETTDAADMANSPFVWCWKPLGRGALFEAAVARIPTIEGYTTEINLEAEALVSTLTERLGENGAMCFIDYGFPRRGYYVEDRVGGTLACHYKHRVHFDPLDFGRTARHNGARRFHRDCRGCRGSGSGGHLLCDTGTVSLGGRNIDASGSALFFR